MEKKEEQIFEIKPVYNFAVQLFSFSLFVLMFILMIALAFWVIVTKDQSILNSYEFMLVKFFLIADPLYLIFIMVYIKLKYDATSYKLFTSKIEYEKGYTNHTYTTLMLKDVKEMQLIKNMAQRFAGLGTIRLITSANSGTNQIGLNLRDIENPELIYNEIKELKDNL